MQIFLFFFGNGHPQFGAGHFKLRKKNWLAKINECISARIKCKNVWIPRRKDLRVGGWFKSMETLLLSLKNQKTWIIFNNTVNLENPNPPFPWNTKDDPILFMGRYLFPICVNKRQKSTLNLITNLFDGRQSLKHCESLLFGCKAINSFVGYCSVEFSFSIVENSDPICWMRGLICKVLLIAVLNVWFIRMWPLNS